MAYIANRPVLIVEGHGDVDAVAALMRASAAFKGHFTLQPCTNPIRTGGYLRLKKIDQLERFVRLAALRADADSIVIALDAEDVCPKEELEAICERINILANETGKKIAFCLFVREFENMFLHCLHDIAENKPELGISKNVAVDHGHCETVRDAKGKLDSSMETGSYKPTRDQATLVYSLNFTKLAQHCRSYLHFERTLAFLQSPESPISYP